MRRISGERVRADERMAVREGCKYPGLSTSYVVTSLRKAARHTAYERRISDLGICSMAFGRAFNNNSNNHTDVYSTVIMERPLREISVSFYECRTAKRLPTPRPCQPTCMGLIGLVCLWVAITYTDHRHLLCDPSTAETASRIVICLSVCPLVCRSRKALESPTLIGRLPRYVADQSEVKRSKVQVTRPHKAYAQNALTDERIVLPSSKLVTKLCPWSTAYRELT